MHQASKKLLYQTNPNHKSTIATNAKETQNQAVMNTRSGIIRLEDGGEILTTLAVKKKPMMLNVKNVNDRSDAQIERPLEANTDPPNINVK